MLPPDLEKVIERDHRALDAFVRGDPKPKKKLFSRIFHREEGEWKIVYRHADPITNPRDAGTVARHSGQRPAIPTARSRSSERPCWSLRSDGHVGKPFGKEDTQHVASFRQVLDPGFPAVKFGEPRNKSKIRSETGVM